MDSPQAEMLSKLRLNKAIAATGLCSRRKADMLILDGKVRINGQEERNPARKVSIEDQIEVEGKILSAVQESLYYLLHKPIQVICTASDPRGRKTVLDFLPPEARGKGLFPVGRLDYFSEGLLLLTNDGLLAQKIAHPSQNQGKIYEVLVRGEVQETALTEMRKGITLADNTHIAGIEVQRSAVDEGNTLLRMILHQGLNRQIRKSCAKLGLKILSLKRIAQGPLKLGRLKCGEIKKLNQEEVFRLKNALGI